MMLVKIQEAICCSNGRETSGSGAERCDRCWMRMLRKEKEVEVRSELINTPNHASGSV